MKDFPQQIVLDYYRIGSLVLRSLGHHRRNSFILENAFTLRKRNFRIPTDQELNEIRKGLFG